MSANEDEGQSAILRKVASGWRRSGSNVRAGKSARKGGCEVVFAAEGDTSSAQTCNTAAAHGCVCSLGTRLSAAADLQLVNGWDLLECFCCGLSQTNFVSPSGYHGLTSPQLFISVSPPFSSIC